MTEKEQDDQFINTYMLTNDEDQSSIANSQTRCIPHLRIIPFIIGVIMILTGFFNMIFFYVYPMYKINENKKKIPDAVFEEPNRAIIVLHFIYNTSVIFCGVSFVLFSLRGFFMQRFSILIILLITSSSLLFIFYITYITICLTSTENSESKINSEELLKIISKPSPIDFAFIYSQEMLKTPVCSHNHATGQLVCTYSYMNCYSKNGFVFPLKSANTNPNYDISNTPSLFYFRIEQEINMSSDFKDKFNAIFDKIEDCNYEDKVIDYYPLQDQTILVSSGKIPFIFSRRGRSLSTHFGVGVYYELSSRAIPLITHKQKVNVELVPSINYDNLWNSESCEFYGECDTSNTKPKPVVNN